MRQPASINASFCMLLEHVLVLLHSTRCVFGRWPPLAGATVALAARALQHLWKAALVT
jgi:hypothetical protein